MNRPLDERERLLAEVLAGERAETDPAFLAAIAADPSLRPELDRLRALQQGLTEDFAAAAADIAAARRQTTAADRERVATFVRRNAARRGWPWPALALAAALLTGIVYLLWQPPEQPGARGTLGDGDGIAVEQAAGAWRARFVGELPPGGSRRIQLLLTDGAGGERRLELDTDDNPWMLPDAWNRAIQASAAARLLVQVQDPGGDGTGSLHAVQLK